MKTRFTKNKQQWSDNLAVKIDQAEDLFLKICALVSEPIKKKRVGEKYLLRRINKFWLPHDPDTVIY